MIESRFFVRLISGALPGAALWCLVAASVAQVSQPLILERTIAMPGVGGRIDHMDFDIAGNRLFVAALASDAVEVVSLAASKRITELRPFSKPQGIRFLPTINRLFVANGGGGGVVAFADGVAPVVGSVASLDDADNLRFDSSRQTLIAGFDDALAVIDPMRVAVVKTIPLAGHPEAFAIERSGRRIFVNVPTAGHIAVVDMTTGKVSATWNLDVAAQNFPMALDDDNQRLFVVTRRPALLLVFDSATGRRVAEVPTCGDSDDLYFDGIRRQLYAICGQGAVDVIRQVDRDHYESVARVTTAPGARTGFFSPEQAKLFVAAPARGSKPAEVRVYDVPDATRAATAK
jgi:DNA-binding beta-propeller fold protein YncE